MVQGRVCGARAAAMLAHTVSLGVGMLRGLLERAILLFCVVDMTSVNGAAFRQNGAPRTAGGPMTCDGRWLIFWCAGGTGELLLLGLVGWLHRTAIATISWARGATAPDRLPRSPAQPPLRRLGRNARRPPAQVNVPRAKCAKYEGDVDEHVPDLVAREEDVAPRPAHRAFGHVGALDQQGKDKHAERSDPVIEIRVWDGLVDAPAAKLEGELVGEGDAMAEEYEEQERGVAQRGRGDGQHGD
eukprot:scaffold10474_cov122-Isochrysis_galbana.AAC.6